MKTSKLAWGLIALVAGLGLGACGGGGGNAATSMNTTIGVITGFGSVYVNGCEYETDSASISVDGQSATEDDLSPGDVVEVTGPSNCTNASASSIKSADELEGWVSQDAVVAADGTVTFEAMGQPVKTTDMTTFEDYTGVVPTLADIVIDNVVEIHGFTTPDGITATRVEVKSTDVSTYVGELELKGIVKNLDNPTVGFFDIGGLSIEYASVSSYPQNLANDLLVEVKFDNTKAPTYIEIEDDGKLGYHGDDDEEIEIYGMLTQELSGNVFFIGEQEVHVTTDTEFEEADEGLPTLQSLISDVANIGNVYLEVEGYFENGVMVADSVEFEDDINDNNEITGTVTDLVVNGNSDGSFMIGAIKITVNNNTMMEDDSDLNVSKFNLVELQNDLATHSTVEVHYESVDATNGIAIKLERK